MEREDFLGLYRHSLAHVLAKAVIEIFGKDQVQYAIGPQIEDGCYYDFVLPRAKRIGEEKKSPEQMLRNSLQIRSTKWKSSVIYRKMPLSPSTIQEKTMWIFAVDLT